ncbi:hypothetical protein DL768_002745 [Monosporascus sp. mg162]|nr:hypothetical protein DL768_002745 [Monosporascus sp. mg162]
MGSKSEDILGTGKTVFIPEDTMKQSLGMSPEPRAEIQDCASLIIHAAPDVNKLYLLVHVSTAYIRSFLEYGEVAEEVYRVGDSEKEIADITAGPAAQVPSPQYMPVTPSPVSNVYARLLFPTGGINTFTPCPGSASGTNLLDEIPVGLVAKMLFQHICRRAVDAVHASSSLYVSKTLDDFLPDARRDAGTSWRLRME